MNAATVSYSPVAMPASPAQGFAAGPHFHPVTPAIHNWWSVMYAPSWSVTQSTWDMWQRMAYMPWNLAWSAWQMADMHTAQALQHMQSRDQA